MKMPEMDGLTFCQNIKDPNIGKILLTGVADQETAIQAFNEGLIDRFVMKSDHEALSKALEYASHLQTQYFIESQNSLISGSGKLSPIFENSELLSALAQKFAEHKIVEHYLATHPLGYHCMDAKGNALRVVIANEQSISKQKDIATMFNAPNTVVQQLEGRESLAYFFESPDDYDQDEIYPWDSFLAPALHIANDDWYLAVFKNVPPTADYQVEINSLEAYITHMPPAKIL